MPRAGLQGLNNMHLQLSCFLVDFSNLIGEKCEIPSFLWINSNVSVGNILEILTTNVSNLECQLNTSRHMIGCNSWIKLMWFPTRLLSRLGDS